MAPAPTLPDLIAAVDDATDTDAPLDRLAAASLMASELAETGDALVGHYVDGCRAAGHTWAEISESLGVSRQAAHKRFSAAPRDLGRWTERAKAALAASVDAARGPGPPVRRHRAPPARALPARRDRRHPADRVRADRGRRGREGGGPHPACRGRSRRAPVHPPRGAGLRGCAERSDLAGPQLHRHRAPRAGAVRARGAGRRDPRGGRRHARCATEARVVEILSGFTK